MKQISLESVFETAKAAFEENVAGRDYQQGQKLLEYLVDHKYPPAQWYYARLLINKECDIMHRVLPDRQRGLKMLQAAANAGVIEASFDLVSYLKKTRDLRHHRQVLLQILYAVSQNMPRGWQILESLLIDQKDLMRQIILEAPTQIGLPFYQMVTRPPYYLSRAQQSTIDEIYGRVAVYTTRKGVVMPLATQAADSLKYLPKSDTCQVDKKVERVAVYKATPNSLLPDTPKIVKLSSKLAADILVPEKKQPRIDIDIELEGCIGQIPNLTLDPIRRTWKYRTHDVCIYIPAYRGRQFKKALYNFEDRNKLHVTECQTIKEMRRKRRFERYVATNNLTGPYFIYSREAQQARQQVNLRVCMNCLKELDVNGAARLSFRILRPIASEMNFSKFVQEYGSSFEALPTEWIE